MKINRKRLQALVSWATLAVLLASLVIEGGGYLLSEYKSDRNRLSEIKRIEQKTGKTVGQLGMELRDYCNDMASTKADERISSMIAQSKKLEKALGYKSSMPKSYDSERAEIENTTFTRCLNLADINLVGHYSYEVSGTAFGSKLTSKWVKFLISSLLALVLVVFFSWASGAFVVRAIPFIFGKALKVIKFSINWITAPEK